MAATTRQVQYANGTSLTIAVIPTVLGTTGDGQPVALIDTLGAAFGVSGNPLYVAVSGTATVGGTVTANAGTPARVAATQASIAVAATTTSTQLLAANANRNGAVINNTSTTGTLYLLYGSGTASATNCTYAIAPGAVWEMPTALVYTGQITGVWSVAGSGGAYGSEL